MSETHIRGKHVLRAKRRLQRYANKISNRLETSNEVSPLGLYATWARNLFCELALHHELPLVTRLGKEDFLFVPIVKSQLLVFD